MERRLRLIWTQPVQMLLEVRDRAPVAVSISAVRSVAAAATWFRNVRLGGGKVVGGDLDALTLVLSGRDAAADEQAVLAAQGFSDEQGKLLPFPAGWLQRVRDHDKPLLAHWYRTSAAAADPVLSAGAEALGHILLDPAPRHRDSAGGGAAPAERNPTLPAE